MPFIPLQSEGSPPSQGFTPLAGSKELTPVNSVEPKGSPPSLLDDYIEHVKGGATASADFLGAIPGSIASGLSVPYSAVKSLATGSDMADEIAKNAEASMKAFQPSEYIKLSPEAERGRQAAQEVFNKPAELGAQGLKGAAMLPYMGTEQGRDFASQMLHGDTPEMAPGFNALTETAGMVPGYGVFGLGGKGGTLEKTMGKDLEGPKDPAIVGKEPTIEDHGKYQVIKDSTGRVTKVVDKETGKVTDYTEPMSQGPLDVDAVIGGQEPPIGKEPLLNEPREPQIGETRSPEELAAEAAQQAEIDFKRSQNINYDAKTIGYDRLNKRRQSTPNAPDLTLETPEEAQARVAEHKDTTKDISDALETISTEDPHAANGRVAIQNLNELKEKLGEYGKYTGEIMDRIQGDPVLEKQIAKTQTQIGKINNMLEDRLIQLSQNVFTRDGELQRTKAVQAKYGKWTREITTEKDKLNQYAEELHSRLNDKYGDFVNAPLPQELGKAQKYPIGKSGPKKGEVIPVLPEIEKSQTYRGKQGGAIDLSVFAEGFKKLKDKLGHVEKLSAANDNLYKYSIYDKQTYEQVDKTLTSLWQQYHDLRDTGDRLGGLLGNKYGSELKAIKSRIEELKNIESKKFEEALPNIVKDQVSQSMREVHDTLTAKWKEEAKQEKKASDIAAQGGSAKILPFNKQSGAIDLQAIKEGVQDIGRRLKTGWEAMMERREPRMGEPLQEGGLEMLKRGYQAAKEPYEPNVYRPGDQQGYRMNKGPGGSQRGAVMNPWERKDPVYQETKQKLTEEQMAKEHEEFARLAQARAPNNVQEQAQSQTPSTTLVGKFLDSAKSIVALDELKSKLEPVKQGYQSIVKALLPLAAGPKETSGLIKTFANEYATALFARARLVQILNHLSKDELKQLYDARSKDEQAEREGRKGTGVQTLPEKLRKLHDVVQNDYIDALQGAQEGGVMVGGYENYTPRRLIALLSDGTVKDIASITRKDSIGGVYGPKKSMGELKGRKYNTTEETEAAARDAFGDNVSVVRDIRALPMVTSDLRRVTATKALLEGIRKYGNDNFVETISTEPRRNWMTLNHPAFRNVWIHPDFHPAIEAILNSTGNSWAITKALMTIKSKSMGLLMFNPLVHGSVIYFKAMPFDPMSVLSGLSYMKGAALRGSPLPDWMYALYRVKDRASPEEGWAYQKDAMMRGFRPPQQAQGARMETSDLYADPKVGNSWTAQLVGQGARLFNKEIEAKQAVDKAGEFVHGSMLWNRITDLGMYVYDKSWRDMVKEGMKPEDAKVVGAHLANRYMGTVPFEAMSSGLRTALNLALFSRQFNVTNMGIYKDFVAGLPNEIQGQIKDIQGLAKGNRYLQTKQGKALVWDIIIGGAVVSSIIQSTVAAYRKDGEFFANLGKEGQGYANRMTDWIERMGHDPKAFFNPEITPMSKNEPGKEERIYLGNDNNNQGMYLKSPSGKLAEDLTSMWTQPIHTFLNKQSQLLKFVGGNDFKGGIIFGSKDIWGPDSKTLTIMQKIGTLGKIIVDSFLPFGNVDSVSELMKGNPNKINVLKTAGALTPFSFSRGQPGGPQQGVISAENKREDFRFMQAKKAIDNSLDRDDTEAAYDKLIESGKDTKEAISYIRQHYGLEKRSSEQQVKMYKKGNEDTIQQFEQVNNY